MEREPARSRAAAACSPQRGGRRRTASPAVTIIRYFYIFVNDKYVEIKNNLLYTIAKGEEGEILDPSKESKESAAARSGTAAGMRDAMKKATTEMLVLFFLKQRPMYAYEMLQEIARLSGGILQFNTLYIAIYRLQDHGFIREWEKVTTEGNRTRVYFSVTESGLAYLAELMGEYQLLTHAIDEMLRQDGEIYEEDSR